MHPEEVKEHRGIDDRCNHCGEKYPKHSDSCEESRAENPEMPLHHQHKDTSPMDYHNLMVKQAYSRKRELEELINRAEYENLKVQNKMETATKRLDSKMERGGQSSMMRVGKEKLPTDGHGAVPRVR